jgi:hypothetical protein
MSVAEPVTTRLGVSALTGTWLNTNRETRGIARFDITARDDGGIDIAAIGTTAWPVTPASVYGDRLDTRDALAFSAVCDLGYADVHLQTNIKGGVLVAARFHRFKDGSGRSSYFMREFYYRVG